jgi:Asp-tRNA(Asn)/Glu-tRNA(Gln) amidotransferase A subunit family amidase
MNSRIIRTSPFLPGPALRIGLPVGLSILGARGNDAALVAVAKALEAGR